MDTEQQIESHLSAQEPGRQADMRAIHRLVLETAPGCRLWFLDGKDAHGKIVTNPNIGYGTSLRRRAKGPAEEFYRIGQSANTSGISLYVMGLPDRTLLPRSFAGRIGKAKVTGYCVAFRSLADLDLAVLRELLDMAFALPSTGD